MSTPWTAGVRGVGYLACMRTLLLPLVLLAGCGNPCPNGITFADGSFSAPAEDQVAFSWLPGTEWGYGLPDAYFEAGQVSVPGEPGVALLTDWAFAPPAEIDGPSSLVLTLEGSLDGQALVSFLFPDRREYVECGHRGMTDSYFLDLSLQFAGGAFVEGTYVEDVMYGAL